MISLKLQYDLYKMGLKIDDVVDIEPLGDIHFGARGFQLDLYRKAIELDNNLILAKIQLGWTYSTIGDYDRAMDIYIPALKQSEELGDKQEMAGILNNIGVVHSNKGNYDTALDYYGRSLAIIEEIGDKSGKKGRSLDNIGGAYSAKGDFGTALDYYGRSLAIADELGDKLGMG